VEDVDPIRARHRADSKSREEISQAEAEIDTGKHSKNPDWRKKW